MNLGTFVQNQWFTRTDDEKFASVEELHSFLTERKTKSKANPVKMSDVLFTATPSPSGRADLLIKDGKSGLTASMTNWAFSQSCALVDAHPSFLNKLPANLAADCLNYLFMTNAKEKDKDLEMFNLETGNDLQKMMALTGGYYGRVWDSNIVSAALEVIHKTNGRFHAPLDWTEKKRSLFASDRDVTMLFIDGGSLVEAGLDAKGNPDVLHRGLLWWNSEVGAGAIKFYTFLFRVCCGNFGIHGIEDVEFTKVRHTINGPARFATDMLPQILKYVDASPKVLEFAIKKAKDTMLPKDERKFGEYFQHRRFTKVEVAAGTARADLEEGGHETLWQMYNGLTAYARMLPMADRATALQIRAGKLLEQVAA